MHLDGFGKTYGLPYQAFDPGTQRGVFAFDLLRMLFPHCMLVRINVTTISHRASPGPSVNIST